MKKLQIKETQALLLSVMVEFDAFCRKHGLQYYMLGGTMLGAVRHKGFIPWDDDIDVGLVRSDYERLLTMSDELKKLYDIGNYRTSDRCDFVITRLYINNTVIDNPHYRKSQMDKRLYFDIFPLDYVPANQDERISQAKKLKKIKKISELIEYKEYSNNPIKRLGRRFISGILFPISKMILHNMEKCMSKYSETDSICSMASQYSYERQLFPKDVYGIPTEYDFEGFRFWGPEKADAYLSQLFGEDYMEMPSEEKRRPMQNIYLTNCDN